MAEKLDHQKENRKKKARKRPPEPPPWPDDCDALRDREAQEDELRLALNKKYGVILDAYERLYMFERVAEHAAFRAALVEGTRREQATPTAASAASHNV